MVAYKAAPLLPEMRDFDGLPTFAVHALMRGFMGIHDRYPSTSDVATMPDRDLLVMRGLGLKVLRVLRQRFPYRGDD